MTTSINASGTVNLFAYFQHEGRMATPTRLRSDARSFDFAKQMKDLVDIYCRDAEVIRLVVDNRAHS
jgi:hypothetical protein